MKIRTSTDADRADIRRICLDAFGPAQGEDIAQLVDGLLEDATARPVLSLVAVIGDAVVGHVLFTRAVLEGRHHAVQARILAPVSVAMACQRRGIGGALIMEGLRRLADAGVDLVFVLGHPAYYPKFGFRPAGALGFEAPYPIPADHAEAWMVQELHPGVIGTVRGRLRCADTLNQSRHWRK